VQEAGRISIIPNNDRGIAEKLSRNSSINVNSDINNCINSGNQQPATSNQQPATSNQ